MSKPFLENSDDEFYYPEDEKYLFFKPTKKNCEVLFSNHFENRFKNLEPFMMYKSKRGYANQREMICAYNNYFIRYYDINNDVLSGYLACKVLIDIQDEPSEKSKRYYDYPLEDFINDIYTHVLTDSVLEGITKMSDDLFDIELTDRNYSDSLKFTEQHAKNIMNIATAIKLIIPLITHYRFRYPLRPSDADEYFLKCYDRLFSVFDGGRQLFNKLYETASNKTKRTRHSDKAIWKKQEIRGKTSQTYIDDLIGTVIINVLYKCRYYDNPVVFLHVIMKKQINYLFKDNFNYDFRPFDSTTETEDGLSTFDKVEIRTVSLDEGSHIINTVNIEKTLDKLVSKYNITEDEISFYRYNKKLNEFQTSLLFQLFASEFGSCDQLYNVNKKQYASLVAIMKRMLEDNNFVYLQHLLSGNVVDSINTRKRLNKNELIKLNRSKRFLKVLEHNYPKTIGILRKNSRTNKILSALINTEFTLVDYNHPELLGEPINANMNILCEDFTKFLLLI